MSRLPEGARFEAELAIGIALWDVSHLLPKGRHRRKTRRPKGRITCELVHHSGALGRPGFEGARNAVRFVVTRRGFPGAPYHYWVPRAELLDNEGRFVVLRLAPDEVRAWHSGGRANDRGLGVALQGNTTRQPMSFFQTECLKALLPWIAERHRMDWAVSLGWHSVADRFGGRPKKGCPGHAGERWLTLYAYKTRSDCW